MCERVVSNEAVCDIIFQRIRSLFLKKGLKKGSDKYERTKFGTE